MPTAGEQAAPPSLPTLLTARHEEQGNAGLSEV